MDLDTELNFSSDEESQSRQQHFSDSDIEQDPCYDSDDEGLKEVIVLVNSLRQVVAQLEKADGFKTIDLPQIIVCGDQSAGKTSVLESISGEEFLPRGIDIQTRYPIVVQLVNEPGTRKWVEFEHLRGQQFYDMTDVRNVLEKRNEEIIKLKKVISRTPTTLTLHSPKVPDLTLVDLPGLVENVVKGQPANLAVKIEELVREYIRNKNSIILAVTAATTDIAASKSIRIAKEVDPKRQRTLGVITKLDLMDAGTTAYDVLIGKKIALELGIIGVVNRSYVDTEQNRSFQETRRKEEAFLKRHYRTIAKQNGTAYLTKTISRLLKDSINQNLPSIRETLMPKIEELQDELKDLGDSPEMIDKQATLRKLVTSFCSSFIAQVDGRKRNMNVDILHAHVKINSVFDKKFSSKLESIMQVMQGLKEKQIVTAILNAAALHSTKVDYDDAFQELAKREIVKMKPVILSCNKDVKKVLVEAIETSSDPKDREMFPRLYDAISTCAKKLIQERFKLSESYLEDYIEAECAITRSKTIQLLQAKVTELTYADGFDNETNHEEDDENSEQNKVEFDGSLLEQSKQLRSSVRREVHECIGRVKGAILEHVPKGVVHKLVYGVSDNMLDVMIAELYRPDNQTLVENLMQPAHRLDDIRKEKQRRLDLLQDAMTQIDNIMFGPV